MKLQDLRAGQWFRPWDGPYCNHKFMKIEPVFGGTHSQFSWVAVSEGGLLVTDDFIRPELIVQLCDDH